MSDNRYLLYSVEGRDAARLAMAEITRLEEVYLKERKRKLAVPLFLSDIGTKTRPIFGITAHFEPAQRDDVLFLRERVTPSTSS